MNADIPIEKRFKILCEITRAQHFAWREAALALAPDLDPQALVNAMWRITGAQTAAAYLKHLDADKPLALQIAQSIAGSSVCMGEHAAVEPGDGDEAFVRHHDCPWYHWHKRLGLQDEDLSGCDTWFRSTVEGINAALGTNVEVETKCALPSGDDCCLRRIWVKPAETPKPTSPTARE
jgi:hypothetical protein